MQLTEQDKLPARTMEIIFTHGSARAGIAIMARLFNEGWETLTALQHAECGHYWTTLYLPHNTEARQPAP
jgi:hypothetical protein